MSRPQQLTPERWERVKTVVADALECPNEARASFVTEACADDTVVYREVESMLAFSASKLDACVEELSGAREPAADAVAGERIGAYELVREIGRGGMGAVYLARRADQEYNKQVAIKLLKRGTDTDEVLRRFRAEREILARLEHPNIARLLDGGTTQDGLPYFVMEHVAGATHHRLLLREQSRHPRSHPAFPEGVRGLATRPPEPRGAS